MKSKGGLFVKVVGIILIMLAVTIVGIIVCKKSLFICKKGKDISEENNLENDRALINLLSDLAQILKEIES